MSSTCKKCRKGQVEDGESSCGGCLAVASVTGELRANWWSRSHRRLAEEVLIQASRQLRAIRSLDTALQSFSDSTEARLKRVVNSQRPPEPAQPPTRRSGPILREAQAQQANPPEGEERPVEPAPATGHRERSRSSGPDYGSRSESEFSSPRAVQDRVGRDEVKRDHPVPEPPGAEGGRDRGGRSRSRDHKVARKRPHHRGGVRHQKQYRRNHHPGQGHQPQRGFEAQATRGRTSREILDSDI